MLLYLGLQWVELAHCREHVALQTRIASATDLRYMVTMNETNSMRICLRKSMTTLHYYFVISYRIISS